ncbi:MAG: 50S ribosomal protein L28 [Candidatus Beckwithbacteria bacterium GW2011_GWB1_47_15]|uniref:Large ribosomal subunit protein bL28 n=1 Tax=Candidatus Beckwithbacteria bacterium GW2011_GWB1_47_15 TaxID=1618371 RepID=A0A0G1U591_9BACT|nr:MAG: 50S ribosomal protein L28, large subunit ribosomal protein L28 [Candidatus Beckwithbacteria bacterium GW2011_GWC1_49_16]KKU35234.1 MAG: 50S ribosomal protein L28 [Candidatus Beckwithbacteria bacterium GW2011_GWA1_46_30]KKU61488.1 MAG: 50S ribosomal protein L28 [Candidatus Beckwithbacteria bacterium GW2011_GWB1_47_15]KKU71692.1 MAG: 50S ribosomal protein L28 [Candidatus Beckwithbacteria bacterium GW2011_GWA2_47_25]KKW03790.1 MAG: 50S ribosomal protein L28 [Candidatus Beckwithbacteria bac
MALKCDNCGKGVQHGNYVSHAKNRTKRTFRPNLKRVTLKIDGAKKIMTLCAKCVKLLKKRAYK